MKMRTKIKSAQNKQAKNNLIYLIIQLAHTRQIQYCTMKSNSLWSSYFISFSLQIQFHVICIFKTVKYFAFHLNYMLLKFCSLKNRAQKSISLACKTFFFLHISVIFQKDPTSLLICTIRSDFKGGRKVVLQIFFFWLETQKKGGFAEPLFCHPQNHF